MVLMMTCHAFVWTDGLPKRNVTMTERIGEAINEIDIKKTASTPLFQEQSIYQSTLDVVWYSLHMAAKLIHSGEAPLGRTTRHLAHMYLFVFLQMRPKRGVPLEHHRLPASQSTLGTGRAVRASMLARTTDCERFEQTIYCIVV